jgi:oligosaccharide repeat unit polymerase
MFGHSVMAYADPVRQTWGFWTFMAIGERLWPGYDLPDGYFMEYFAFPGVIQSNIYTMFRGLIYDFGWIGSLVFMASLGWISSLAYRMMLKRPAPIVSQAFFIFLMGFLYSSFLFSLLTWTSVYVAALGVALMLAGDKHLRDRVWVGSMRVAPID